MFTNATGNNGIAIGLAAKATESNSIALGVDSTTSTAISTSSINISNISYTVAGGSANSTCSIGTNADKASNGQDLKRTLTNLAAGRVDENSTDATNGSQLNAVIQAINALNARLNAAGL